MVDKVKIGDIIMYPIAFPGPEMTDLVILATDGGKIFVKDTFYSIDPFWIEIDKCYTRTGKRLTREMLDES